MKHVAFAVFLAFGLTAVAHAGLVANGSTVTGNVQFEGKTPIKVRYVLVFRDNMIVSEVWQIDPKLLVAGAMPATTVPAKSTY